MDSSFSTFQNALAYMEQQDRHRHSQYNNNNNNNNNNNSYNNYYTSGSRSSGGNRTPGRGGGGGTMSTSSSTGTGKTGGESLSINNGYLPTSTMAVPVQYLGSTDITGLHTPAHFYRVILPPVTASLPPNEQDILFDASMNNNNTSNDDGEKPTENNFTDENLFDDEASPIIYVMSKSGANVILAKNHQRRSLFHHQQNNNSSSSLGQNGSAMTMMMMVQNDFENVQDSLLVMDSKKNSSSTNNQQHSSSSSTSATFLQDALVETIEFAHIQCLLMSKQEAQKLIDEAGCVPSRIWKNVPLMALCASSDFPIASATALSTVGKVFLEGGGDGGTTNQQQDFDDDEDAHDFDDDSDDGDEDEEDAGNDDEEKSSSRRNQKQKQQSSSRNKNQDLLSPTSSALFVSGKKNGNKNNSVVGVRVSLARARRVIHIMNEGVVSNESSSIAKVLRGLCAALWCALIINASEEALEYVKPSLSVSGNTLVGSCHAARLWHIRRLKRRRESLFTVDATAGALLNSELRESKVLTQATTAIKQQLYRSLGKVTDLVGSAMRHDVDWSDVERPPYGRELRRTHFRPLSVVGGNNTSNNNNNLYPAASASSSFSQQQQEPIFLWSKALPPIPVVLSRQGWERCIQRDPVMWRFKSLPVRLKETTTKLSRYLSCSVSDLLIAESTQIARATVLRSLPWTPGDTLLLVDGLPPGVYTALSSFLKEQNGVTIHTIGMSHPISSNSEVIVSAFSRAIDLVKPLVCIIPHVTRTGHVLPIDRLIPLCRQRNVVVMVDGTDVLNNVAMQVGTFGADFYIAPLDSHMFCPAGLTALVVSKTRKKAVDTLTVSYFFGQGFEEEWTYTGLTDQSRMISIIQAMQFNKAVCPDQSQYTKQLAAQAHDFLTEFWNVPSLYDSKEPESAIVAVLLPLAGQRHEADARFLQALLTKKQVFVEVFSIRISRTNDHKLVVRLVFYPYNDMLEVKGLAIAMQQCIAEIS